MELWPQGRAKSLQSCPTLCEVLWTVARQAPLSMGFSRKEYRIGLLCPPPGDLPDPGTEPTSLTLPALAGGFFTSSTKWEAHWPAVLEKKWRGVSLGGGLVVYSAHIPELFLLESAEIQKWNLLRWWRRKKKLGKKGVPGWRGGGEVETNVVCGRGEGNRMAKESDVFQEEGCWGPVF